MRQIFFKDRSRINTERSRSDKKQNINEAIRNKKSLLPVCRKKL